MPTKFVPSTGLLIGIVTGGTVLVSVIIIVIVRVIQLTKRAHRQAFTGDQHLNRSIGSPELEQIQRGRNVLRSKRLPRTPCTQNWIKGASHDSLIRRSALLNSAWSNHSTAAAKITRPSRPVPHGLVRSKVVPLCQTKSLPPITEQSLQVTDPSLWPSIRTKKPQIVPSVRPNRVWSSNNINSPQSSSRPITSDSELYAPRSLLLQGYNYSHSEGDLSQSQLHERLEPPSRVLKPLQSDAHYQNNISKPYLNSDSFVSLYSEQSGYAPTWAMPDLPADKLPHGTPLWNRMPELQDEFNHDQPQSPMTSCASIHSSILDNDVGHFPRNIDRTSLRIQPSSEFMIPNLQSQSPLQQSFTPSVGQYDLTRSPSSGLAPSIVDRLAPSRDDSFTTNPNGRSFGVSNICANPIQNTSNVPGWNASMNDSESREGVRITNDRSPLAVIANSSKKKRASTSILQSAGQSSPIRRPSKKRPSSFPCNNGHIDWDDWMIQPGMPSAMKRRSQGHKRQGRVRISSIAPLTSPPRSVTTVHEQDENLESLERSLESLEISETPESSENRGKFVVPTIPQSIPDKIASSPHPPSRANFDPQLKLSPQTKDQGQDDYYSATMSMFNFHDNVFGHPSDIPLSTPTRNPSQHRKSCKPQDDEDRLSFAMNDLELALITSPRLRSDLNKHSIFTSGLSRTRIPSSKQTSIPDTRPPSFLFSLPNPATEQGIEPEQPSTPTIQGPRAAPFRKRPPKHRSPSRSPTRGATRHSQRPSPLRNVIKVTPPSQSSSSFLATNIKEQIRRHNSDAVSLDPIERKNYLNMGERGSIFEEGGDETPDRSDILPSSMLSRLSSCQNGPTDGGVVSPFTMASRGGVGGGW